MAGSSTAEHPRFFYDLASVDAWLAAERIVEVLGGVVPEFVPVALPGVEVAREDVEARAAGRDVMPVLWPPVVPPDSGWAMLVAQYAKGGGRVVAYSLAAFRQCFNAG